MSEPTDQTGRPDAATCDEIAPYLSAYVDGELTPALQAKVTAHLATCLACTRKAQRYRDVNRKIALLPSTSPSPEVFERIQAAIAQRGPSPVVRESLHPAKESPAASVVRLLSPKVVYPQEPEHASDDDDVGPPSFTPARLPRTPFQRRAFYLRSGLSTLVALLIISLTVALFRGLAHEGKNTNPIVRTTNVPTPVSNALRQTASALHAAAPELAFTPLTPGYLPDGAQFVSAPVLPNNSVAKSMRYIEITWDIPQQDGLTTLHLREALDGRGWSLIGCQSASASFGGEWLTWGLPGLPDWQALTCDQQSAWPAVGQVHTEPTGAGLAAEEVSSSSPSSNLPPSSVGEQTPTQVDLAFIAQPSNVSDASSISATVQEERIASLSMDSSYQQQMTVAAQIGAQPQSTTGLFLHFTAQASNGAGNTYAITGQTNAAIGQSVNSRRERIEIVNNTTGAETTDIVQGTTALRLQGSSYSTLSYPADPLLTGLDGEPRVGVTQLLVTTATQMQAGIVWVIGDSLSHPVTYQGHTAYELAVVNAPALTLIYVDSHTNKVIGVTMQADVVGGGAASAPSQLVVSGGCSNMPNCSITYTELWWGTATNSNSFSLTPPAGYTQSATPISVGFQCEH